MVADGELSRRWQKILEAVFERPTRSDIKASEAEGLIQALGGKVEERAGSRVAAVLEGAVLHYHRPHKPKTLRKYQVEVLRDWFDGLGIRIEKGEGQ